MRPGATGEELGVGATVGHAGDGVGRVVDHLGHEVGVEAAVRAEELDLQVALERQVQHDLDVVLALLLGDLAERRAHVLLEVGLAVDALHDQLARRAADAGLDRPEQASVGFLGLVACTASRRAGSRHLRASSPPCVPVVTSRQAGLAS